MKKNIKKEKYLKMKDRTKGRQNESKKVLRKNERKILKKKNTQEERK